MRHHAWDALSWLLCIPLIALAVLPSFLFTYATNVPSKDDAMTELVGEPLFIACVQVAFNTAVFPSLVTRIVRMAYTRQQLDRLTSATIIQINSHKLSLSIVVELVSTLVAPVIATLLMDESCMSSL